MGTALALVPLTWLIVALCRPADRQAPARLPRLRALPAVTMKGGAKFTLGVVVERQGCTLPLTVTVEGLPDQVTHRPLTLVPGEESGGLELAATPDAEAASRRVVVALRAGERKVSEQAVKLTVEKLVRPRPAAPRTEEKPPPPRPVVNSLAGGRRTEPAELTLEVKKPVAAVPRPPSPPPVLPARPVSFATADGVTLHGTFYPVPRAREAVCVLMLHELGGEASEGWKGLAEALQARGHAVLDFDFRGYGRSTGFSPRTFWGCRENRALLPARITPSTPMPAALNAATFPKTYYPWLVQDVAAARLYLEAKNDAGEVNSARLVLLGAGEGATLGALWLVWECCRYEPDPGARPGARRFRPDPEARDVLAALWVRMALTLGGVPMLRQPGWLRAAGRQRIPMKFLYAEQDVLSGRAAQTFVQALGPEARDLPLTGEAAVRGKGPFGQALSPDDPEVRTVVRDYVDAVSKQPGLKAWSQRGPARPFAWVLPSGREFAGRVQDVPQPVPVHQGH